MFQKSEWNWYISISRNNSDHWRNHVSLDIGLNINLKSSISHATIICRFFFSHRKLSISGSNLNHPFSECDKYNIFKISSYVCRLLVSRFSISLHPLTSQLWRNRDTVIFGEVKDMTEYFNQAGREGESLSFPIWWEEMWIEENIKRECE